MNTQLTQKAVIPVYGVSAVGKTTLCHLLPRIVPICEIQSTDNLLAIERAIHPNNKFAFTTSYRAWSLFGSATRDYIISGFCEYRACLGSYIQMLIKRVEREQFVLILDGIHFSPNKHIATSDLAIIPILLVIGDKKIHRHRIIEK